MRDHNYFEDYMRHHRMRPQGYVDSPQGKILLADSEETIIEDGRTVYRTGYGIDRGGMDIGNYNDYPASDAPDLKQRLNEAVIHARETMRQLEAQGYYG